jgi:hypothetical protein
MGTNVNMEQKSDSIINVTLVAETMWRSCGVAVPLNIRIIPIRGGGKEYKVYFIVNLF